MMPALPEVLPDDPLPLLATWFKEAAAAARNWGAMALATVDPHGRPSARMVICRGVDPVAGWLVFYTDRDSEKGRALAAHPRASVVFHWDALERQVRVDGPVTLAPDADSDAYWSTRPRDARLAAIASDQSKPIASRAELLAKVAEASRRFEADVPRPPRWGGYRIWIQRLELWAGQPFRIHDRALWTRALRNAPDGFTGAAWSGTRLQP